MTLVYPYLGIALILFSSGVFACEPPPPVGSMCGQGARAKYDAASTQKLLKLISTYDHELSLAIKTENPKAYRQVGDGSCFLMNSAKGHLESLAREGQKSAASVCEFDLNWILSETENLVALDSRELQVIKTRATRAKLEGLAVEVINALRVFAEKHQSQLARTAKPTTR